MFGLGAWEIALILGAALIFLGPEKLPEIAKTLGKTMRTVRRTASEFTREIQFGDERPRPKPSSDPAPSPYEDIAREEAQLERAEDADEPGTRDKADAPAVVAPGVIAPAKGSLAHGVLEGDDLPSESERG